MLATFPIFSSPWVSGYSMGSHKYRTTSSLQGVLLNSIALLATQIAPETQTSF